MAISFLFNTAGFAASSISVITGATATGFQTKNIISGSRETMWRAQAAGSAAIGYVYSSDVTISHIVVSRADLLLTKNQQRVLGQQRSSGGTWSNITGFDKNPLVAADLIGPKYQDLVVACTPTNLRGVGIASGALTGSEAMQISKLYGANAFSFSSAVPSLGIGVETFLPGAYQKTFHGSMEYEVEKQFSLSFVGVSVSEMEQLLQITNFFHWPLFIYDPNQEIWEWKLEHVIVGGMSVKPLNEDSLELELTFFRLRHYD